MNIFFYSTKPFEIPFLEKANKGANLLTYTEKRLTSQTAMLALKQDVVSIFSADDASAIVLQKLYDFGVRYITLRSSGYDNINVKLARKIGFKVANAHGYSPNAIAEHAITLLLALNRKIPMAQSQTLRYNFLLDNLIGFDLFGKKVGVMGVGNIGSVLIKILYGFDCRIYANDNTIYSSLIDNYNITYISKAAMAKEVQILFICLPLSEETYYLFNDDYISTFKNRPIIINIARGAVVNTSAMLDALDVGLISGYAADVYEKEHNVFFYKKSKKEVNDPLLHRLLCHPKTIVTPHQAFATKEALEVIASKTIANINAWKQHTQAPNELY